MPKTVSQLWKEKTGLPWKEAHKRGFTTGTFEDNIALQNKLNAGGVDVNKPYTIPTIPSYTGNFKKAFGSAYKELGENKMFKWNKGVYMTKPAVAKPPVKPPIQPPAPSIQPPTVDPDYTKGYRPLTWDEVTKKTEEIRSNEPIQEKVLRDKNDISGQTSLALGITEAVMPRKPLLLEKEMRDKARASKPLGPPEPAYILDKIETVSEPEKIVPIRPKPEERISAKDTIQRKPLGPPEYISKISPNKDINLPIDSVAPVDTLESLKTANTASEGPYIGSMEPHMFDGDLFLAPSKVTKENIGDYIKKVESADNTKPEEVIRDMPSYEIDDSLKRTINKYYPAVADKVYTNIELGTAVEESLEDTQLKEGDKENVVGKILSNIVDYITQDVVDTFVDNTTNSMIEDTQAIMDSRIGEAIHTLQYEGLDALTQQSINYIKRNVLGILPESVEIETPVSDISQLNIINEKGETIDLPYKSLGKKIPYRGWGKGYYLQPFYADLDQLKGIQGAIGFRNRLDNKDLKGVMGVASTFSAYFPAKGKVLDSNGKTVKETDTVLAINPTTSEIKVGKLKDFKGTDMYVNHIHDIPTTEIIASGSKYHLKPFSKEPALALKLTNGKTIQQWIGLGADNKGNALGNYSGGNMLFATPDGKHIRTVSGSGQVLKAAFNDFKNKYKVKYANVLMLDAKAYVQMVAKYDNTLKGSELRSRDNINSGGGHLLYISSNLNSLVTKHNTKQTQATTLRNWDSWTKISRSFRGIGSPVEASNYIVMQRRAAK